MGRLVIIPSKNGQVMGLIDVIHKLPSEASKLTWSVLAVHGIGNTPLGTIRSFERMVAQSPNGIILPWDQLVEFAREVEDLFDVLLVGFAGPVPLIVDLDVLTSVCSIALQLFDSSFWQCFFRDNVQAALFAARTDSAVQPSELIADWKR